LAAKVAWAERPASTGVVLAAVTPEANTEVLGAEPAMSARAVAPSLIGLSSLEGEAEEEETSVAVVVRGAIRPARMVVEALPPVAVPAARKPLEAPGAMALMVEAAGVQERQVQGESEVLETVVGPAAVAEEGTSVAVVGAVTKSDSEEEVAAARRSRRPALLASP